MKLVSHDDAWAQYLYWQATDQKMLDRINLLIKQARRAPFTGIGKPEPLRGKLSGWWSRRINHEHRLIYRATDDGLFIAQCRHHY
ncbi:Txe/YoeB family addiction module toxin [Rhizobium sp.]